MTLKELEYLEKGIKELRADYEYIHRPIKKEEEKPTKISTNSVDKNLMGVLK